VTEILFTCTSQVEHTAELACFVEPRSCQRALSACPDCEFARLCFHTDPLLPNGSVASVDSTDADLNALRTFVDLAGLIRHLIHMPTASLADALSNSWKHRLRWSHRRL